MTTTNGSFADDIVELDRVIDWYEKQNEIVERECGVVDGKLIGSTNVNEYNRRRHAVYDRYAARCHELIPQLDRKLKALSKIDFDAYLNDPPEYVKRWLMSGSLRFFYADLDRRCPRALQLPLSSALCVEQADGRALHRLMLNMLFTLPIGLCRFHVFDPNQFGGSIGRFDVLNDVEEVFPDKRCLCDEKELKALLEELANDFARMRQKLFPANNCRSWAEYNRKMRSLSQPKKQLPYRVLICFELPTLCTLEDMQTLKRFAAVGRDMGFLLMFSYDPELLIVRKPTFDGSMEGVIRDRVHDALRALHASSVELSNAFVTLNGLEELNKIVVEEEPEEPINPSMLERYLIRYRDVLEEKHGHLIDFDELINRDCLFDSNSGNGLNIPLGSDAATGNIISLNFGDATPHALVAGQTGSGKSNLLHILIANACWHYSPDELNVYLLDFKDGVEFAAYSNPILPHAGLVAVKADAQYAQTVLHYLRDESTRRNEIFKSSSTATQIKSIADYRAHYPHEKMPRIILIIDEFQKLFDVEPARANEIMQLLLDLAKQGRSVGVHLLLATQTLKGVGSNVSGQSFSSVQTQFKARIALSSTAEDSKYILSMNNEAAAQLKVPFAILNDNNGSVGFNRVFAVPEAKSELIRRSIETIISRSTSSARNRIFNGQELPALPSTDQFARKDFSLLFGRHLDFDGSDFELNLPGALEQNVLVCAEDGVFFECVMRFARSTTAIDELIYVGKHAPLELPSNAATYSTPEDFLSALGDERFDKRRLIVLDECSFPKAPVVYGVPTDAQKTQLAFHAFWQQASEHGSHVVAFYRTLNQLNNSNVEYKKIFAHRIMYHLPPTHLNAIGGLQLYNKSIDDEFKAAYVFNERLTWFQPFRFQ